MRVTDDGKTVELGTVSDKGLFTVSRSQSCAEVITFTLSAAPINDSLQTELSAEWADFRGTQYTAGQPDAAAYSNNGVTAAKAPIYAAEGTLYWAKQIGNGYGKDAVGCPILAGDALITYSGNHIYRIDPDTGKTLTEGTMVSNSSYSIVPPTYSDGMVFVGLKDGQIQAFDAVSLKSLWVYTDPLGGQPNSPITVRDGYLYTGFWNGETKRPTMSACPSRMRIPHRKQRRSLRRGPTHRRAASTGRAPMRETVSCCLARMMATAATTTRPDRFCCWTRKPAKSWTGGADSAAMCAAPSATTARRMPITPPARAATSFGSSSHRISGASPRARRSRCKTETTKALP